MSLTYVMPKDAYHSSTMNGSDMSAMSVLSPRRIIKFQRVNVIMDVYGFT